MSLSIFEQVFHNYAHKCNCNEAIENRIEDKNVHRLKTSSIKLTSDLIEGKTENIHINLSTS